MKPYINLFTGICLALATIFLSGMDGCSPTDEADPAAFVSASPTDGSTLQESATIVATFDAPPSGLDVNVPAGVTFSVTGSVVTITGGFKPGPLSLVLTWDDGTTVLNYTVPDPTVTEYDGKNILFEQGSTLYEGYVIKGVSATEVLVLLEDRSEKTLHVDRIRGTEIADHPDTKKADSDLFDDWFCTIIPWDDAKPWRDSRIGRIYAAGPISRVYSDGTRRISIGYRQGYVNRNNKKVEGVGGIPPANRAGVFRYKKLTEVEWTVLWLNGKWKEMMEGYITMEEYLDWLAKVQIGRFR